MDCKKNPNRRERAAGTNTAGCGSRPEHHEGTSTTGCGSHPEHHKGTSLWADNQMVMLAYNNAQFSWCHQRSLAALAGLESGNNRWNFHWSSVKEPTEMNIYSFWNLHVSKLTRWSHHPFQRSLTLAQESVCFSSIFCMWQKVQNGSWPNHNLIIVQIK